LLLLWDCHRLYKAEKKLKESGADSELDYLALSHLVDELAQSMEESGVREKALDKWSYEVKVLRNLSLKFEEKLEGIGLRMIIYIYSIFSNIDTVIEGIGLRMIDNLIGALSACAVDTTIDSQIEIEALTCT